ncbi:hypothetical protein DdX_07568 [Ditylenchus destructor]|uniref:Uncharacterized protein n=1 Tax=Ditylenchus destructor TaxID=166010 RepID=A0AAD4R894_9BILA|nr:hypothetical protein DdX_07568 [Ditylenchus destructor]
MASGILEFSGFLGFSEGQNWPCPAVFRASDSSFCSSQPAEQNWPSFRLGRVGLSEIWPPAILNFPEFSDFRKARTGRAQPCSGRVIAHFVALSQLNKTGPVSGRAELRRAKYGPKRREAPLPDPYYGAWSGRRPRRTYNPTLIIKLSQ